MASSAACQSPSETTASMGSTLRPTRADRMSDWLPERAAIGRMTGLASCRPCSQHDRARPHAEAGGVRTRCGNRSGRSTPAAQQARVQATPLRIAQQMSVRSQQPQDLQMRLCGTPRQFGGGSGLEPLPLGRAGRRWKAGTFCGHGSRWMQETSP
ncbi:hypothetical protein XAP412_950103 [Xanthomonas phaseoli pv. phaseoli]|uniref:Uncharacterized protein n=1 Tax=Xanthomonas campestris pv. phaseoli TaxID=317013 RepID=A0AB38E831_XANCH|nr:hypothetical protein XAP6984_980104 [Xanthomonas phaseoli pv. phaseoli]SON91701.1 hypothetical protein XAP412_950103 [Xanthomonas phaseoli pv. phaseoli]SON93092.1 hypothetical protein XAP7430_970104 [Xanthomonas phaseoli pv. phaseoli]